MKEKNSGLIGIFKSIARFSAGHPWPVLGAALVLTVIMGILASMLDIQTTWMDMVPKKSPSVQEMKRINTNFGAASDIIITLENNDPERLKAVSRLLVPRFKAMSNILVDVTAEFNRDFILSHGFMLQKAKDLKQLTNTLVNMDLVPYFSSLNENFEKTYIGGEESLENNEVSLIQNINSLYRSVIAIDKGLDSPDPKKSGEYAATEYVESMLYSFSLDNKMLMITMEPKYTANDMNKIAETVFPIRKELELIKAEFPDITFRLTGMHVIFQDEMDTSMGDSTALTIIAFLIVLAVFVIAFKMWGAPLMAMITLMLGITWTMGIAAITVGKLNLFTSMAALILIGLGVDYFVHLLSGYTEGKNKGLDVVDSSVFAMEKVGEGVFIGALTTASAFFVLAFVDMELFQEMGIVLGTGIVCTMAVSFILLPAIMAGFFPNKKREHPTWLRIILIILMVVTVLPGILWLVDFVNKKVTHGKSGGGSKLFGNVGKGISKRPGLVLIATFVVLGVLAFFLQFNKFDENLMNLEMKGLESVELQREIIKRYGMSDGALVYSLTNLEKVQTKHELFDTNSYIGMVTSIASFVPREALQDRRIPYLNKIQSSLKRYTPSSSTDPVRLAIELDRFRMNILEIGTMAAIGGQDKLDTRISNLMDVEGGDKMFVRLSNKVANIPKQKLVAYQFGFASKMKDYLLRMANPQKITLDTVPQSVKNRYISKDGKEYLTYVYSKTDIWEKVSESPFIAKVEEIVPHATGMSIFVKVLLVEGAKHGTYALIIAIIAIFILLLIDFRNIKAAFIAILPLAFSSVAIFGVFGIFGYPVNIMMVMAFPMIIGIGIDDGVHLLHRFRIEGNNFPHILASTGKALFLTTFTTCVAFGSLGFARMRGLASMGIMLFIGLGFCYVFTVTLIAGLLSSFSNRFPGFNIDPWGSKKNKLEEK